MKYVAIRLFSLVSLCYRRIVQGIDFIAVYFQYNFFA